MTISCSACGTAEVADAAIIDDAPTIVCRNCGETWPAERADTPGFQPQGALVVSHFGSPRRPQVLEAQRRPLVSYTDGAEKAWAAKIAADVDPAPPRRSRWPQTAGILAAALFLSAFFGGREAAVASLPDLAGLYGAIGLPVNIAGLAIEAVSAHRAAGAASEKARVTVRGTIRNGSAQGRQALPLAVELTDAAGHPILSRAFNPPSRTITAGGAQPFQLEFDDVPRQAARIVLRFRQPSNPQVAGGEVKG